MAKKIVSLLCALAMLVTMVSLVATFTASAADPVTVNPFADGGTWDFTQYRYRGPLTEPATDVEALGGPILHWNHSVSGHETVTAASNSSYDLGDSFTLSFMAIWGQGNYGGYTDVRLGKLAIRVTRESAGATTITSGYDHGNANIQVLATYDGTQLAGCDSGVLGGPGLNTNDKTHITNVWNYTADGESNVQGDVSGKANPHAVVVQVTYDASQSENLNVKVFARTGSGDAVPYDTLKSELSGTLPADADFSAITPAVDGSARAYNSAMDLTRFALTYTPSAPLADVITLNGNGGTVAPLQVELDADGHPVSLPVPTRAHYSFDGWFTAADGGTQVTTSSVLSNGDTVHAHWTALQTSPFPAFDAGAYNVVAHDLVNAIDYTADTRNFTAIHDVTMGNAMTIYTNQGDYKATLKNTYDMSAGFSVDFYTFWDSHAPDTNQSYFEVSVGKLTFRMTPSTNGNNNKIRVYYDGTLIDGMTTDTGTFAGGNSVTEREYFKANYSTWVDGIGATIYGGRFVLTYDGAGGVTLNAYKRASGSSTDMTASAGSWSGTIASPDFANSAISVYVQTSTVSEFANGIKTMLIGGFTGTYDAAPAAATYLVPTGAGLTLDSSADKNTAINVVYFKDEVDAEGTGFTATATLNGVTYTDLPLVEMTINSIQFYVATLPNVTPNLFGTKASFTLTNGTVTGDAFEYSVKDYCDEMIADANASANLKAVCANLLVYGEAVRAYVAADSTNPAHDTNPTASITAGTDVSDAITSHGDGADITSDGNGFSFAYAQVHMRENISLSITIEESNVADTFILVCQPATGTTYRLTYSAAVSDSGLLTYVIPVGITNVYTTYSICMVDATASPVSATYQMSVAGLCKYYEDNGSSTEEAALGVAILNLATAVAAL